MLFIQDGNKQQRDVWPTLGQGEWRTNTWNLNWTGRMEDEYL